MPDDYYVSQYSGEEIDDLLGKVGSATGAVRYDAAQPLTDAQKQQARGNIGAAPSRFGLGENLTTGPLMQVLTKETLDTTYNNGWYFADGVNIAGFSQATIRVDSSGRTIYQTAYVAQRDGYVLRRCLADTIGSPPYNSFGSWEWVNPPMQLGVEYRTTERYLVKPVYVKVVNCGQISDGKEVEHGIPDMDACIMAQGIMSGLALPRVLSHDLSNEWSAYISQVFSTKIRFECGTSVVGNNISAILKYTKTTD